MNIYVVKDCPKIGLKELMKYGKENYFIKDFTPGVREFQALKDNVLYFLLRRENGWKVFLRCNFYNFNNSLKFVDFLGKFYKEKNFLITEAKVVGIEDILLLV